MEAIELPEMNYDPSLRTRRATVPPFVSLLPAVAFRASRSLNCTEISQAQHDRNTSRRANGRHSTGH
jgi:hypothetical protein